MRILITGGTGFLGPAVISEILNQFGPGTEITLVSRKKLPVSKSSSVQSLVCDLTNWNGGLEAELLNSLTGKFDLMLHMAGLYNLRVSKEDAYLNNVFATHTALAIAQHLEVPCFAHVSTVAVTMGLGTLSSKEKAKQTQDELISRPSFFNSNDNSSDQIAGLPATASHQSRGPFPDAYAESKASGEKTVRAWESHFPKRKLILRPGILVGATDGSAIRRIDGPYHAIDAFRRMRTFIEAWRGTIVIPGRKNHTIPLVPVDYAGKAIASLLESFLESKEPLLSYYVAPSNGPTVESLFQSALSNLGLHREVRTVENIPGSIVKPIAEWLTRLPREEIEYVLNLPAIDTSDSDSILGVDFYPRFKDYEASLWKGYHAYIQSR
ncbi:MAG: SDR family oxidoreductase [Deltaproteobacteria bacterium]|nr:SDR family oxidoreductase [Deltaproteobacteria bacterium]